jgi:DNA-binding transcriptional LysR family regulator
MHDSNAVRELLPDLARLAALAEEPSLRRAARRSGTSQPTLTRAVQRWESQLGVKLTRTSGRGTELTEEGRLLAQAAQEAARAIEDTVRRIRGDTGGFAITVGFLRSLGPTVVGELVSSFVRVRPEVAVLHRELFTSAVLDALDRGDVDVAVTAPQPPGRFAWLPLGTQAIVLMVPNGHRLSGFAGVHIAELAHERILALDTRHHTRQIADSLCSAAGIQPRIVMEADDLETLANYAAAGHGVAIVPADSLQRPRVTTVPFLENAARRAFGLAWQGDAISETARAFIGHARDLGERYPRWADIDA